MTARLGPQIELVQKLFLNSIPSAASLSIFGVGFTDFSQPSYAPIACGACSSEKIKTMFGRSAAMAEPTRTTRKLRTHRIRFIKDSLLLLEKNCGKLTSESRYQLTFRIRDNQPFHCGGEGGRGSVRAAIRHVAPHSLWTNGCSSSSELPGVKELQRLGRSLALPWNSYQFQTVPERQKNERQEDQKKMTTFGCQQLEHLFVVSFFCQQSGTKRELPQHFLAIFIPRRF